MIAEILQRLERFDTFTSAIFNRNKSKNARCKANNIYRTVISSCYVAVMAHPYNVCVNHAMWTIKQRSFFL